MLADEGSKKRCAKAENILIVQIMKEFIVRICRSDLHVSDLLSVGFLWFPETPKCHSGV